MEFNRSPVAWATAGVINIMLAAASATATAQQDSASALFAHGDFPAAARAYAAELRADPADVTAALGLGAIEVYRNHLDAAESLLQSALAAQPQNTRATRLLTEVARRKAEAARRSTLTGSLTTVAFVAKDPLPVVRVVANGVAANFVVDTGGDVDLEPTFAVKVGVKAQNAGFGTFAGGRQAPVSAGTLRSLQLGAATAYDVPVHVMPTHAASFFGNNLHIDGIVGTTYFERFLVTIDYPHNRLIVRARSPQTSNALEASAQAANAAVVPCYLVGDHFVMAQAQVNDAPPGLFVFDSGLAGGGLMPSAELVKSAGIALDEEHARSGMGGGGEIIGVPLTAQRVAVGSAVVRSVRGLFTPQGTPFGIFPFTVWGAISQDFLRHYAYTVDFDAMKIVLQ
jgi:hypothetical protein